MSQVSAVVLAGGHGRRLGRDKASLELGGETLLQRMVRLVSRLSHDVIVVVRPHQQLHVDVQVGLAGDRIRTLSDAEPYVGVLAGIASGLAGARHDWCLVAACDMPFISLDLLQFMVTLRQGYDAVVPRLEVGLEPLLALYHRCCLPALWRALEAGKRRVVSFYGSLRVRYVEPAEIRRFDPTGHSFHNINVPEDLAQAREWLRAAGRQGERACSHRSPEAIAKLGPDLPGGPLMPCGAHIASPTAQMGAKSCGRT